jgi:hypothetical protein
MEENQRRFLVNTSVMLCLFGVVGCSGSTSKVTSTEAVTQVDQPAFKLTLKYEIGQTVTYCLSTEVTRSVEFEGIRADNKKLGAFSSAMTGRLYDVTWTQRVQDLDPNGQALLSIKITGLGYKGFRVGELTVDYDSTRAKNAATALADLLGITYHVRLNTKGHVLEVMGVEQALARLDNGKADIQTAKHLISDAVIKTRHTVKALNSAPDQAAKQGTWTDSEAFSFGKMGSKRFDKTYTCLGVKEDTPLVEVSLKGTESPGRNLTRAPVPKMPLASKDQYIGMLVLDTKTGQIKTYHETLAVDWVVEDAVRKNGAEPRKIHMTQRQAFLLERKDVAQ